MIIKKNTNKDVCIAVPLYKLFKALNNNELSSLIQLYRILGEFDIYFFCASDFDLSEYLQKAHELNNYPGVKKFDKSFFTGTVGYNNLMLQANFYSKFSEYKFLLVYQLDAFVFRNELHEWCQKGYDFIGAPWFEGWGEATSESKFIGTGNGGFSLRNLKTTITLLKRYERIKAYQIFWTKSGLNAIMSFLTLTKKNRTFFQIVSNKNIERIVSTETGNEDSFITQILANTFGHYNVATYSDALKFSFEVNPSFLYESNSNRLPFGCHGWEKYEPEFWRSHILNSIDECSK